MIEKRREKRIKEENRVAIAVSPMAERTDGESINAFTKDLSLTGARIWTDRLFPLNSRLNLTLHLSRSKQIIRIRGTVKWEKKNDDGLYEIGVQFHHGIPDVLIALIHHFYGKEEAIPTEVNRGRAG
ncbi:MAG: PilZ domain [Candidatus Aminicenantes bacterium]|jgi:c-di-GMP-binding flagellar brake protein YcgR|nr:PilZ domain [Candidatus Aminicenantes bacterium]